MVPNIIINFSEKTLQHHEKLRSNFQKKVVFFAIKLSSIIKLSYLVSTHGFYYYLLAAELFCSGASSPGVSSPKQSFYKVKNASFIWIILFWEYIAVLFIVIV